MTQRKKLTDKQIKALKLRWSGMKSRCRNDYCYYRRGIRVCERWKTFENFVKDMGPIPTGAHIDRIDGNKDYSPDNCRWVAPHINAKNQMPREKIIQRSIDPDIRDRQPMIRYPSRIEESIIDEVNAIRKRLKMNWPDLTRDLLKDFIELNKNNK